MKMGGDKLLNSLERWIAPWKRRILSMVGKCIIEAIRDDSDIQLSQISVLDEEVQNDIERVQEFGFTSVPPKDSEGIVLYLGGNQQHGVIIATDSSEYRLKGLPDGATAIYNRNGDYVKLTDDIIEVFADSVKIGKSNFKKLVNEAFQSVFNNHVHNFTAAPSGVFSTSTPAALSGTPTTPPVGGAVAAFDGTMGSSELTSKTEAE